MNENTEKNTKYRSPYTRDSKISMAVIAAAIVFQAYLMKKMSDVSN